MRSNQVLTGKVNTQIDDCIFGELDCLVVEVVACVLFVKHCNFF